MFKPPMALDNSIKQSIHLESLLPSFQDAVTACRGLKIRYLWIDSLSIIQDNDADKAKETSQMSSIYAYCTVTLAVNNSANHTFGFLRDTDKGFAGTRHLLRDASGREFQVCLRPNINHEYNYTGDTSTKDVNSSTLSHRAWTFHNRFVGKAHL